MKAAQIIAPLALVATLLPPVLSAVSAISEDTMKSLLLMATFAWFATASFWLKGGER